MTINEIERGFQEIWELFKENEKRFKETDRILEERFKETDNEISRTSRTVEETSRAVNALTGKWSKFVEGLIAPSVERLFKERGIEVDKVYQRVKTRRNGEEMEVDILAINGEYAILIEAKSTLKVEDIEEHVERLENFKRFFPEYADRKAVGALGGIVIEEESDRYAYKKGLFVIAKRGESVKILNDEKLKPRVW